MTFADKSHGKVGRLKYSEGKAGRLMGKAGRFTYCSCNRFDCL